MAGFSVYKQISWDNVPTDFTFTQYVYESWDFVPTFNEHRRIKWDIVTLDFVFTQYASFLPVGTLSQLPLSPAVFQLDYIITLPLSSHLLPLAIQSSVPDLTGVFQAPDNALQHCNLHTSAHDY